MPKGSFHGKMLMCVGVLEALLMATYLCCRSQWWIEVQMHQRRIRWSSSPTRRCTSATSQVENCKRRQ